MTVPQAALVAERTVRYLATPAVVGHEQPFLDVLDADLRATGRTTDRRDGLLAARGPGPVTLSAHIDRHGLVTTAGPMLAYAADQPPGSHRPLTPRLAASICGRFDREGVVAYDSATGAVLAAGTVEHGAHCGIGIGLELVADGLADLPIGTPVAFAAAAAWDGSWLRGQLDNAVSAAIAIELIHAGFDGTVLFTCGEEAGRSWEPLQEWFGDGTRHLIVLDTSPFDTSVEAERGVVVLRHADAGASFDSALTDRVTGAARADGIDVVWKDDVLAAAGRPLGRTELGRVIVATAGRATGTTVQVPTTDYHSNHEATTATAIAAVFATLAAVTISR